MRHLGRVLLFALILLWPAVVTGGATWFVDLKPYVRGGFVAVETVMGSSVAEAPAVDEGAEAGGGGGAAAGLAARSGASVSGVRSVAYSVAAYLSGLLAPGFWALALFQAATIAVLVAALSRLEGGPVWAWGLVLALGAAPLGASSAGPDVWAGIVILAALLLFRHGGRLHGAERGVAIAALAFGVAAHASHVLLAGALALGALLLGGRRQRAAGGLLLLGVAGGVAAILAASLVGFGEASLAPKRYPIVLARAIEDGPALWHLEEHCDEYRYTVCEVFPDGIPRNVGAFLWAEGGVRDRATPAQMEAIRAEEPLILRRALAEYPFFQLRRATANLAEQFALVIEPPRLGEGVSYVREGEVVREGQRYGIAGRFSELAQGLAVAVPLLLLGGASLLGLVRIGPAERRVLLLLGLGLLANAAVCGVLSVPEARYQARVIWVAPLVALGLLASAPFFTPRQPTP